MRLLLPIFLVLSAVVCVSSALSCYNGSSSGNDLSQANLGQELCTSLESNFCVIRYYKDSNVTKHSCGIKDSCRDSGMCVKRKYGYTCCCNSPLCNVRKPKNFEVVGVEPLSEETRTCLHGDVSTVPSEKKAEPVLKVECSRGLCVRQLVKVSAFETKYNLGCASEESSRAVCRDRPACKPSPEGNPEECCCDGKDCNSLPWTTVAERPNQSSFIPLDEPEEETVDGPRRRNKNPLKNLSKKTEAFFRFLLKQLNCIFNFFGL